MRLDDVDIPGGEFTDIAYARKLVEHLYVRSDTNHVSELGMGITRIRVSGQCGTRAERDALVAKIMQSGSKNLYFASQLDGDEDDRYFVVYTSAPRCRPRTATVYDVEFDALAADSIPYVTATDAHAWE